MARKIARPEDVAVAAAMPAPAPEAAPQDDAAARRNARQRSVLHPERSREIAGRLVEMREYGYIEGLRVQAAAAAFLEELFALFPRSGPLPTDDAINALIARHVTAVHWMMAQAMTPWDDDLEAFGEAVKANTRWIGQLGYEQGEALKNLWWSAAADFFFRLLRSKAEAQLAQESPSASAASITP